MLENFFFQPIEFFVSICRYLTPGSAPPAEAARPDLDSLIAAIGRIGAQLQQVRDNARADL